MLTVKVMLKDKIQIKKNLRVMTVKPNFVLIVHITGMKVEHVNKFQMNNLNNIKIII